MSIHPLFGGRWIARYWKWLRDRDERRTRLQIAKVAALAVLTDELLRAPVNTSCTFNHPGNWPCSICGTGDIR